MKITIKPKTPIKILGIDPSLTHTGLIVISPDGSLLHSSTLAPKTKGVERLLALGTSLADFLTEHKPTIAVMEGYAYTPRAGQAFSLGELGGILKVELWKARIPLHIVQPMTLKKFATGSGKGDKSQVMLKVYKKWKQEFKDDHQTDAFVLAQIGRVLLSGNTDDLAEYEKEVIEVVLKSSLNTQTSIT